MVIFSLILCTIYWRQIIKFQVNQDSSLLLKTLQISQNVRLPNTWKLWNLILRQLAEEWTKKSPVVPNLRTADWKYSSEGITRERTKRGNSLTKSLMSMRSCKLREISSRHSKAKSPRVLKYVLWKLTKRFNFRNRKKMSCKSDLQIWRLKKRDLKKLSLSAKIPLYNE